MLPSFWEVNELKLSLIDLEDDEDEGVRITTASGR
jgi:hypothetical protein